MFSSIPLFLTNNNQTGKCSFFKKPPRGYAFLGFFEIQVLSTTELKIIPGRISTHTLCLATQPAKDSEVEVTKAIPAKASPPNDSETLRATNTPPRPRFPAPFFRVGVLCIQKLLEKIHVGVLNRGGVYRSALAAVATAAVATAAAVAVGADSLPVLVLLRPLVLLQPVVLGCTFCWRGSSCNG